MNNTMVKTRHDCRIIEGWRGAYCECGRTIYMPAPSQDGWYTIICPECGFSTLLFCRKKGKNEKDNIDFKLKVR